MKLFFLTISLFCLCIIRAQKPYDTSLIIDSLKTNADAVKRLDEMKIIVKSPNEAVIKQKYAITILNENGADQAILVVPYDKKNVIEDINGTLWDEKGEKIKSLKKKDISDKPTSGDENLMMDTRFKLINFYYSKYPYTVEYEVETTIKSLFFIPNWDPIDDYRESMEKGALSIEVPNDYNLRCLPLNMSQVIPQTIKGKTTTYVWNIQNFKAIEFEKFAPIGIHNILPKVIISPSKFSFDQYTGDMSTWKDFGQFSYQLYEGRNTLPPNVVAEVHSLTDGLSNTEKIRKLYQYLQQNYRYISVQLGIGGWQPFDANFVAKNKYGDCKALSNYMYSLLKEASINSYPVLIKAGERNTDYLLPSFSSNFFNHVILCVPQEKDSIWLECTSQTLPMNYLSSFTANRKALMITPNGGIIVETPKLTYKQNGQIREASIQMDVDGNLKGTIHTNYTGQQQESIFSMLHEGSSDDLKKYLNRLFDLPTYEVTSHKYVENMKSIPQIEEDLDVVASNYATVMGKRIVIVPNLFNLSQEKLPKYEVRKTSEVFTFPFEDIDSVNISVPSGYIVEALPKPVIIMTKFGRYSAMSEVKDGKIIFKRKQERYAGEFAPTEYNDMIQYFEKVYEADRKKIVLVKQ
ncbi:DUF3857 domain-containing protein [Rhizosphaericola mali]|uniref:DUF3857 domain-containing protein n=1 Tax=Rhizosphaericola mali TaxID=2545455 RepID=A0A5P2G317_9BACT|nr:DUF3857 domain-containing protein [Rhizosphaericola mali]QES90196.1 DUF3857 domain-containing protein [Rhizosphaericola mali]